MMRYSWIFVLAVALLASCGDKKNKNKGETKDTTANTQAELPPNQPEVISITVDSTAKKAKVKFKVPRKIKISVAVTNVEGVGLSSDQVGEVEGEFEHTLDLSDTKKFGKGLYYVNIVTYENKKAVKEMILK
ncbi:hypothetical protein [Microscilla marina]|uniref:Lipoprotein, putative n=1 Tax=Microscilla marina ATCC 23134 TaxID=313606 RepID=A1ZH88_MICM2|nr:hypothetical protein [Microscilla marina]EAY30357.1 lipoprotein, putative [Microscilla marina ATCC 23134]